MKTSILAMFLTLISLSGFCQSFTIVGKGNAGETKCTGSIRQSSNVQDYIYIELSDMLNRKFNIFSKEQINERTIRYKFYDFESSTQGYIVKYKCPYGKDV